MKIFKTEETHMSYNMQSCKNSQEDSLYHLNLPASLSVGKQEIKSLIKNHDLKEFE